MNLNNKNIWDINKGIKLKKLEIKNYKIFKNFNIKFFDKDNNIQPIIVLAGINGTGKTTILETISVSSEKNSTLHTLNNGKEQSLTSLLKTNKKNIIYSGFSGVHQNIAKAEPDIYYYPVNTDLTNIKKIFPKYIDKLIYEKDIKASEVYKKLKDIINDEVFNDLNLNIEFEKMDGDKTLSFKTKINDALVDIDNLSTGEKTILSKILDIYLTDMKDKIILIDEPELSLHPSWQNKVLKLYESYALKNNCQIIIATHSPHILNSAKNEYIRILNFRDNQIEVIDNVLAYGRDIKWILKEVMGIDYIRGKNISQKFDNIENLIDQKEFDNAQKSIEALEELIGENDKMILNLKNEIEFERFEFEADN